MAKRSTRIAATETTNKINLIGLGGIVAALFATFCVVAHLYREAKGVTDYGKLLSFASRQLGPTDGLPASLEFFANLGGVLAAHGVRYCLALSVIIVAAYFVRHTMKVGESM